MTIEMAMHPVEEFYQLREQIKALKARSDALRSQFMSQRAPRCSNRFEVRVRQQTRRVLNGDALPPWILNDDRNWRVARSEIVTVHALGAEEPRRAFVGKLPERSGPPVLPPHRQASRREEDDFDVIERS